MSAGLDLEGIARHIANSDEGNLGLIGLANSINAALPEESLTDHERDELTRLREAAIHKAGFA
jgi:hypothetical protein